MKKLKSYITALSTIMLLGACNKELDLKPFNQIESDQAINTSADVKSTLIGAYNRASLSYVYGGGFFLYPDLLASQTEVDWQGTYQELTNMVDQQILVNNSFVNSVWLDSYRIINQVNNVLANIDKVDAGDKDDVQGQAEFLRGLTYFDLARNYGKAWNDGDPNTNLAVPLVLTPTTVVGPDSYPKRATVAQIYAQAIADLTDAEAKMNEDNSFFASKYAASAILARLYLQQGDYAKALAEANNVIKSGDYSLVSNYSSEFPFPNQSATHVDNTTEDIFAIQLTNQLGTGVSNDLNTFYSSADYGGRGDIVIQDSFLEKFTEGDTRLDMYQYDSDDYLRCDKFDNMYGNVHVVRLAEMYLIRAECNFRLGSATGATPTQDVNTIRARAKAPKYIAVTLAQILNERVLELAFEGFFLHDAKRTKQAKVGAVSWDSPKLVFPIPSTEMNANPNLVQNDGYIGL